MDKLANKLKNWEATPPSGFWDKLSQDLPDHGMGRLAARLEAFESTPPSRVWNQIAENLDSSVSVSTTPVIPFRTRYRKHIRVASAAVFAGMIFLGAMLLIPKRTDSDPVKGTATTEGSKPSFTRPANDPGSSVATVDPATSNSQPANTRPEAVVRIEPSQAGMISFTQPSFLRRITTHFNTAATNLLAQVRIQKPALSIHQSTDKYMVYSDDEGNAFKLPKKLYDEVACQESDIACHLRLRNLQAKISEASLTSDFTGVMEILESLDQ